MVEDHDVLEFIGRQGKSPLAIKERFPDFDVMRLVRAHLVELLRIDTPETQAHGSAHSPVQRIFVLTPRGAEAVGIDPATPHMA